MAKRKNFRTLQKGNGVQNFKCIACGRQFAGTRGTPFYRKRSDARETLALSVLLNIRGEMSFRRTNEFIELISGVRRVHTTYYYRHLSSERSFEELMRWHRPQFGTIWHIDEVFTKVQDTPGEFGYLFVVTDQHSNIIALHQAAHRDTPSARYALKLARKNAGFTPDIIVRDGCPIYDRAVTIFGRQTKVCRAHFKAEPFILHKNGKQYLYFLSNNVVEHVNSFIRQWMHHMRGFKSRANADRWCKMFQCCYNFLRGARLTHLAAALFS